MHQAFPWWYPVGAQITSEGTHFRVWAPERQSVRAMIEGREPLDLQKSPDGYFQGVIRQALEGARYAYEVDGEGPFADPASRFQPDGPHHYSQAVDPTRFRWTDADWKGLPLEGQILYEMHIGTFTREGTYCAAVEHLPALAKMGITTLEIMPLADFPGGFALVWKAE
jgi:maltooligosyltrehalose trehalohydrolase